MQRVRVQDAPGYEDFEGKLFTYVQGVDGGEYAVILCETELTDHLCVIDSEYVTELESCMPDTSSPTPGENTGDSSA